MPSFDISSEIDMVELRNAVSMAIDRDKLTTAVTGVGDNAGFYAGHISGLLSGYTACIS